MNLKESNQCLGWRVFQKLLLMKALRQHKKISEMKTFRGYNRDGVIRLASNYILLAEFIIIQEHQRK